MTRVLIAGIETVVGANLAALLSDRYDVFGLGLSGASPLAACETASCGPCDGDAARSRVAGFQPNWIVLCGDASRSSWTDPPTSSNEREMEESARIWASIARDFQCRFTMISSDAVFTGPWLFHGEECPGECPSTRAKAIRRAEEAALRNCSTTLVVRTNAYGWSAESSDPSWIEQLLEDLERGSLGMIDSVRHATPILATDLAALIEKSYREKLTGIFHIAGAERISPAQFVDQLAEIFELSSPHPGAAVSLTDRPTGFGRGETSLQTRKIRQALEESMSMVIEGLTRLRAEQSNGHRRLLERPGQPARERVA